MDNNNPGVVVDTPKPKSSKGLVAGMVICAAIGLAGAGFGGYMLIKGDNKSTTTTNTETVVETKPEEKEELEESPITAAEAETILEKYIDKNKTVSFMDFFSRYAVQDGFSESLKLEKLFLGHSMTDYVKDEGKCEDLGKPYDCYGIISFNDLNERAKEFYGDSFILEQKNYTFGTNTVDENDNPIKAYRITYDEGSDSFVVYGPWGLGGTSSGRVIRKVTSVKKEGNNVVGQLVYDLIDVSYTNWEEIDTLLNIATNNLTIYNFTLSPYNDTYVLTAFEKAE